MQNFVDNIVLNIAKLINHYEYCEITTLEKVKQNVCF
jgi:hypothetical protein